MSMIMETENKRLYFLSEIYDSREKDMVWHRAVFKTRQKSRSFSISFYAANVLTRKDNEREETVETLLYNYALSLEHKKAGLKPYFQKEVYQVNDLLLHDITGRYLWFIMEYEPVEEQTITAGDIRIYFPKQTWLSYLPEIYAKDQESASFLERYLTIFRSLYEDLNEEIQNSPVYFLPEICKKEFLPVVAGWLHEEKYFLWKEDQLRYLLSHAVRIYQDRGTVEGLRRIVALYTGEKPCIVEYHRLKKEREGKRKEIIRSLYGEDPFTFTLLVKEEHVPGNTEYKTLKKIIEDEIPAHMECKMTVIRPYIFLNSYSYLGINSVLGKYRTFDFDKPVIIPLSTITD